MQKSENILLSIVVPIYNSYNYLKGCLDSIEKQRMDFEYEIICVDDGSSELMPEFIASYIKKHPSIRFVKISHGGQGKARNVGIGLARGHYIYFMDSDDELVDGSLKVCVEKMISSGADLLLFNAKPKYETVELEKRYPFYNELYKRKHDYPLSLSGVEMLPLMYNNGDYVVSPCCYVVSSEVLKKNKITFPEGIIYEDNVFTLKIFLFSNKVVYVPSVFFIRLVREGSTVTRVKSLFDVYSYFRCFLYIYDIAQQCTWPDNVKTIITKIGNKMIRHSRDIYEKTENRSELANYLELFPIFGDMLFKKLVLTDHLERNGILIKSWSFWRKYGTVSLLKKIKEKIF